jgi:hypothetical protein
VVRVWNRLVPAVTTPAIAPINTYQFQVLATGEFPLNEEEQTELLQFFLEARDRLRRQFTSDAPELSERPDFNSTNS